MKVTIYHRPDGRKEIIECKHVHADDAAWFEQHNVRVSMEDIGGQFAVYADIGLVTEDDELIELSAGKDCYETMAALRKQCEGALTS